MYKKFLAIAIACMMSVTVQVNGMNPQPDPAWFNELVTNLENFDLSESNESESDSEISEMSDLELPAPMQPSEEVEGLLAGSCEGA
jgi:hypothetical protein